MRVIVDQDLRGAERLIFHPNINTASVTIAWRISSGSWRRGGNRALYQREAVLQEIRLGREI